jgi:LSD1 subclass zinc finger protein
VDGLIFERSAPPVNVIGGIVFADGTALYPRPGRSAGSAACASMDRNIWEARRSIKRRLLQRPPGSREISGAMCFAVLEPDRLMLRFSGNFASPRG